jgi:hypothetical protein
LLNAIPLPPAENYAQRSLIDQDENKLPELAAAVILLFHTTLAIIAAASPA